MTKRLPKGISVRKGKKKVSYIARYQYNGQRYTLTADTVKEVQQKLKELKFNIENNINMIEETKKVEKITLNEWFEIWLKDYKELTVKKSTCEVYKKVYNKHIASVFGQKYINEIKSEQIQIYFNRLAKSNYKRGTIESIMIVLSNMLKQAYINERIEKNPCNHVTKPKLKETTKKNLLSLDQEQTFLSYCNNTTYKDIFIVALYTGMRVNEILGLTWNDIDYNTKMIHVNHTLVYKNKDNYYLSSPKSKTSKRDIPILKNVYDILDSLYNNQDQNSFIFNNNSIPISCNVLDTYISRIVYRMKKDNINIKHLSMHCFRHTFATRCIEQGVTPQTLKVILGHSSLSMTMDLYAHVQDDTKQKELSKLENILK